MSPLDESDTRPFYDSATRTKDLTRPRIVDTTPESVPPTVDEVPRDTVESSGGTVRRGLLEEGLRGPPTHPPLQGHPG